MPENSIQTYQPANEAIILCLILYNQRKLRHEMTMNGKSRHETAITGNYIYYPNGDPQSIIYKKHFEH
jgi:hypothetical protein